jgi:hypothetical protein
MNHLLELNDEWCRIQKDSGMLGEWGNPSDLLSLAGTPNTFAGYFDVSSRFDVHYLDPVSHVKKKALSSLYDIKDKVEDMIERIKKMETK